MDKEERIANIMFELNTLNLTSGYMLREKMINIQKHMVECSSSLLYHIAYRVISIPFRIWALIKLIPLMIFYVLFKATKYPKYEDYRKYMEVNFYLIIYGTNIDKMLKVSYIVLERLRKISGMYV